MAEPDHQPFLGLLAETLVASLADGGEPALVHVVYHPDGPAVGILPLEGMAPAEYLLGTAAPAEWAVLGAATRGRARPLSGTGPASSAEVVVLVPRAGEVVGRMQHGGETITAPPAYGVTVDCLQRALGLPTAPPQEPPVHLIVSLLLEAVIHADDPRPALAALCDGTDWSRLGWDRLRQLAAGGQWPGTPVAPEDAAWFDEGSFSRWALGGRPPLPALVASVAEVVGVAEARRCAGALADMGLDVAWPAAAAGLARR